MLELNFKVLLPAIIFSLCILEMSFGLSIRFYVVYWFYFYFIWSLFNIHIKSTSNYFYKRVNLRLLFFYFLSCLIYIIHHIFGFQLYEHSTSESFNILWWTIFGSLLITQIWQGYVNQELFYTYVRKIVFFGCIVSSSLGLFKYVNILSGNFLSSYYYNDQLLLGSSLSQDYNVYALGLSIGILLSVGFYNKTPKKYLKVLYILAICLLILAILLSGSRRGILMCGFNIFCLVYSYKITKARKQIEIISNIFFPIVLIFVINNSWDKISEYLVSTGLLDQSIFRVLTLKDEIQFESERSNRFLWSLDYFLNKNLFEQIFGSGFDYLKLMGRSFSGELEDNPHNYLFSALLYGGFFGFFLIIFLCSELISSSFHYHRVWFPVVLIILIFGLTSSNSLFAFRVFPTLLFLMSLRSRNRTNGSSQSV
jgi:hypothetical protein